MSQHIYRSETLRFDPYQTNGTAGGRMAEFSVSAFDSGSVQFNIELGPASVFLYPTPADLRRLGHMLVAAADGAEPVIAELAVRQEQAA